LRHGLRGSADDRRGRVGARGGAEKHGAARRGRRVSSSAPPPELRGGSRSSRIEAGCANIVTSSDLVTSAQEQANGAPPLCGIPTATDSDTTTSAAAAATATAAKPVLSAAPSARGRPQHRRSASAGVLPQSLEAGAMDSSLELADAALALASVRPSGAAALPVAG
ncbi:unnamed protein product, partial [Scytosiphon promiscuus]